MNYLLGIVHLLRNTSGEKGEGLLDLFRSIVFKEDYFVKTLHREGVWEV